MKAPICVGGGKGRDTFVSVLYALVDVLRFFNVVAPLHSPHQPTKRFTSRNFMFIQLPRNCFSDIWIGTHVTKNSCGRMLEETANKRWWCFTYILWKLHLQRESLYALYVTFSLCRGTTTNFEASGINTLQLIGTPHTFFQHMLIHCK
jgi:hypothetical protein